MKKLQILIILCSFTVAASAQNFLLYNFKGNVSVIENKIETKAKVGKPLTSASSLKIAAGGAVTLICNEAAMFTLTKPGTYALNKFGDSCHVSSNSVSANYVKYVWASMTKSSGSAGSDRKTYMNTVGAVSRNVNPVWIDYRLDTINYSGGDFALAWKVYPEEIKEFDFYVYSADNLGDAVYKTELSKTKVSIPSFTNKLTPGTLYYWTAAVKGQENDVMKVLNYVTKETFDAHLADIKSMGAPYETPAQQAYRIAFMLEDSRYLAEAFQYYTKATALDPNNALYRSTLMSFKVDYQIK